VSSSGCYCLSINPANDFGLKDVEREGTVRQEFVMEHSNIEPLSESFLRPGAEFTDLELANLVCKGLSWPRNVTVNL
jgi:hypothetical protein